MKKKSFGILLTLASILVLSSCLQAGELTETIRAGWDFARVQQLLAQGADVNEGRGQQRTPLHEAAYVGWFDVAQLLIEKGADVNARSGNGSTPLHSAAISHSKDSESVAMLLIQKGADVNARNNDQETPLHMADKDKVQTVALLLQKGAEVNARDKNQRTPLHWAADESKLDIMALLIRKGADVNARNHVQKTPLHEANANKEVAELLIRNGADVNARNRDQETPLHLVMSKEVAALLIQKGADVNAVSEGQYTPLHWAAYGSRTDIAELLIQQGAKVNARDKNQQTPLHLAAENGKIDAAALLIKKGAEINARDKDGQTPAMIAEKKKHPELVAMLNKASGSSPQEINDLAMAAKEAEYTAEYTAELKKGVNINTLLNRAVANGESGKVDFLIRKGADVNARVKNQGTPLSTAAFNGRTEVVALLIEKGADVNERDFSGRTLLHDEANEVWGKAEIAALLIQKGADVNARDKDQITPLHLAASQGRIEIAKLLVEKGADVNARGKDQKTPLHLAADGGNAAVAALLIEKGADVNARSEYMRQTPLHRAAYMGHKEVVALLIRKGADINVRDKEQITPAVAAEKSNHPELAAMMRKTGGSARQDLDALLQKVAKAGGQYYFEYNDDLQVIVRLARSLNPPPSVPPEAQDEMFKGKAAFKLVKRPEDFKESVEHFKKAVSLAPWLPEPYFNLALAQEKLAVAQGQQQNFLDAKRSLGYYLIAAPSAKDSQAVRQKIADLDMQMKRWGEFEEKVNVGVGIYKSGPNGYNEAIRYWKWAIEICPEHPEIPTVYKNIAHVSIDKKDWDEALKYMQKVLELEPTDPVENNRMGYVLQARGDMPKACQYYKKACNLGNQVACKNLMGQCP